MKTYYSFCVFKLYVWSKSDESNDLNAFQVWFGVKTVVNLGIKFSFTLSTTELSFHMWWSAFLF
jgi:hypothetical protein